MCGIVGFIDKKENIKVLEAMLEVQSYRGPDANGVYFDKSSGLHLGHNRLSIQDLTSNANQPMRSDCDEYVIVFNGEVYNFKGIQKELENLGYEFSSNSDTEVILYSYKEWGIKAIEKFVGMFAFCILDKINKKLYLVRDRVGVKPLYYYEKGQTFLFSSEIKSFHKHPSFKKEINKEVLPYYFSFGYIPEPLSIFQDCFKLEAGHYLEYNLETSFKETKCYWSIDNFLNLPKFDKSEDEILEELENIIDDSLELRMISDVPVGIFLSGGYDSSLISAILSKKQNRKLDTFTIGFEQKDYNEAVHAKGIANFLDTNHHESYISQKEMIGLVEKLPFYFDEPFGDTSSLPMLLLSDITKKNVSVALSGDGGDELFCGYSKYFVLNKYENSFNKPFSKILLKIIASIFRKGFVSKLNSFLPKSYRQKNIKVKYEKFFQAIYSKTKEEMFINGSSSVKNNIVKNILQRDTSVLVNTKFLQNINKNFLEYMMQTDFKTFLLDDVLVKVDRTTMASSLEGREPLLDHRLIEYLAQVPIDIKYKNNEGKYLLRKILYKYIPKELIERPKSGFHVPIEEWLLGDLKSLVAVHINRKKLDDNIFNVDEVLKLKENFFLNQENSQIIWFILVFQMWKEIWYD